MVEIQNKLDMLDLKQSSQEDEKVSEQNKSTPRRQPLPEKPVPLSALRQGRHTVIEPSYMQEFREISSQYQIEQKEDSVEISSNGEFERADKMEVYNEEDTELAVIEATKRWQ